MFYSYNYHDLDKIKRVSKELGTSPAMTRILVLFYSLCEDECRYVSCSRRSLAIILNLKEETVKYCIRQLHKKGFIDLVNEGVSNAEAVYYISNLADAIIAYEFLGDKSKVARISYEPYATTAMIDDYFCHSLTLERYAVH